jgi:hypothetical protein
VLAFIIEYKIIATLNQYKVYPVDHIDVTVLKLNPFNKKSHNFKSILLSSFVRIHKKLFFSER